MRAFLLTLLVLGLLTTAAPGATAAQLPPVECDQDDDLYTHCNAGKVHWVRGPGPCVGVKIGGPAPCREIVSRD